MSRDVLLMKEDNSRREMNFYVALGKFSAVITIVPASMAAGWIFGHYLVDRVFGTGPWGAIAFLFVGAGAGFYEIAKLLMSKGEAPQDDDH